MISYRSSFLFVLLTSSLIIGCGKSADQAKDPPPPPPPKGTVFDGLISQKERVLKGTDAAMEKNKEKLDQALKQNDVPPADEAH